MAGTVVPPLFWPSAVSASTMSAEDFEAATGSHEEAARKYRAAAVGMEQATEGAFSEAAICEHQLLAVDHTNVCRILNALAAADRQYAAKAHDLAICLNGIDRDAQQRISQSPPAEHGAIIAEAHKDAAAVHAEYTAAVARIRGQTEEEVSPLVAAILGRTPAPPNKSETTQALDSDLEKRGERPESEKSPGSASRNEGQSGRSTARGRPDDIESRGEIAGDTGSASAASSSTASDLERHRELAGGPIAAPAAAPQTPAPLSPLSNEGASRGFGSGGIPGTGGFGSGSSLSGMASAAGNIPGGAPASGLSAVPGSSTQSVPTSSAAVDPGAFARGVSASSGATASVSPVGPAPSLPGPAGATSTPVPAAGPVAGSGVSPSMPTGLASGAHTPAPPGAGSGGPGAGASAPPAATGMMLPAPGMGGPAAQGVSGGLVSSGTTVPATASASGASSAAGSGATAAPTVVPASVVTPAAGSAGKGQQPSADVLAATRLAWELARAGDLRKYPLDWAVGVFRSAAGSETVVISNDGSGYVPEKVFLPREVQLLVADPLVDNEFRDYWFGWQDPARILVAYAALRADTEWKLVAAATTGRIDALREAHIECGMGKPRPITAKGRLGAASFR